MKTLIIIFGLLYAVNCKPVEIGLDDYLDDGQTDNEDYNDDDDARDDDNVVMSEEQEVSIITKEEIFERNLTETVLLPCVFSGDYVRIWRKNGAILFQSTIRMGAAENVNELSDGTLQITNLTAEDAGQYECAMMVSNPSGKTKIIHTLKIKVPPRIESLTAKDNVTVIKSGDTLSLTCTVTSYPAPKITWHKDGKKFPMEGEVLTIPNVKHHNAGEYMCAADNKIGNPATMMISIKVEFKPMVTVEQMSVSSAHNLETELECIVHAEPKANVVWTKDGVNIVNSQHTVLSSNERTHSLLIKGVQESDFGVYSCLASNYLGVRSKNLTVVKTPAVVQFIKPKLDNKELVLAWEVQSKSPISTHELQYRKKGEKKWHVVNPEHSTADKELYTVKYTLKGLESGDYETRIRSKNENGWSEYSEIKTFEGVHAKHGHHDKTHKKPHRDGKEKQIASTQEVVRSTEPSPVTAEPAKHQEVVTTKNPQVGEKQIVSTQEVVISTEPSQIPVEPAEQVVETENPPVGANESSGCAPLTSAVTIMNVALVVIFLVRPPTIRI